MISANALPILLVPTMFGDGVALHEVLREALRSLEASRRRARAEREHARVAEGVDQAGDERRLGPHDDEVDRHRLRERHDPVEVARLEVGDAHRDPLDPLAIVLLLALALVALWEIGRKLIGAWRWLKRVRLAWRYYRKLGYSWRLSWDKSDEIIHGRWL